MNVAGFKPNRLLIQVNDLSLTSLSWWNVVQYAVVIKLFVWQCVRIHVFTSSVCDPKPSDPFKPNEHVAINSDGDFFVVCLKYVFLGDLFTSPNQPKKKNGTTIYASALL